MAGHDVTRTIEAVWRIESARLIAGIARLVRDVPLAEDLAQEALVAALEQWPESGVPDNPGAWLMATAKHRGVDRLRRAEVHQRKTEELGRDAELRSPIDEDLAAAADDPFDDDLLRLIFTACHPVLSPDARVALTLRLLCGLTTREIARAYLASESAVAQRIVRAKRTLSAAHVPFVVPGRNELRERLASVLEVVYLIFNEGYSATAGERLIRPELMEEALRLGRILAELLPREAEVHGLVALMELQASRTRARISPAGDQVLLLEQDRSRWDWLLVGRGLAALERAYATGGPIGPYTLQAGIAACHARARAAGDTDWERIVALYDGLAQLMPSPVVELNRAVAVGMAFGPQAALEIVDRLREQPALDSYHLLPSVRADLLDKLGRPDDARAEFERAAPHSELAAAGRAAPAGGRPCVPALTLLILGSSRRANLEVPSRASELRGKCASRHSVAVLCPRRTAKMLEPPERGLRAGRHEVPREMQRGSQLAAHPRRARHLPHPREVPEAHDRSCAVVATRPRRAQRQRSARSRNFTNAGAA
jgi:RNA polymerase sigma-70 factor, ECF subfamily